MYHIANPIYDIVFKYLMEDKRIVCTILSALLKKNVVEVDVRRNEYANVQRDSISIYRIDFGAKIQEDDGSRHLVLIELQKTWLETETLRFRQYLGVHYSNPENMVCNEDSPHYGLPMITVYLLGHKVGNIEEPVLYVRRKSYDYYDNEVTQGLPDPFVDSLTHDSIIVQIPRLTGKVNNRLEKVLSIFNQSLCDSTQHILNFDETLYADDEEMLLILHRLLSAAADAEMRHNMNVEDEYFSVIEKRDTELLKKNRQLAEQTAQLKEQAAQLQEKDNQIRNAIRLLASNGVPLEVIAGNFGLSVDYVQECLRC